jgi:hypothetical protein
MVGRLEEFPYWELEFDEHGQAVSVPDADVFVPELNGAGITDLIVFSHGWNNTRDAALDLYRRFFRQVADLTRSGAGHWSLKPGAVIGVAGVIWPSMRWADEPEPGSGSTVGTRAAAAIGGGPAVPNSSLSDAAMVRELAAVFRSDGQRDALSELARLLETRPNNERALQRFQELMGVLMGSGDGALEDQGQRALVEKDYREVFERMATAAQLAEATPTTEGGGAAGGGLLGWLWDGAKYALRQATYWEMKERAGVIGERGLGPLVGQVRARIPTLRLHFIGHSFGARLLAFTLKGLPPGSEGTASPVKSLTLLQGAFSHFAFAPSLPQDRGRAGALQGMEARVDGPIVASFSEHDTAVGVLYPWASVAAGQDAADINDPLYPWGAMGQDGAQAVKAAVIRYGPPGTAYSFAVGRFYNLDGNDVIVTGRPPSGAHSDICHPQTAWAVLAAAGLVAV